LSEQQIRDLRAGLGLSLALAAEFNGYPGPRHRIELADALACPTRNGQRYAQLCGYTGGHTPVRHDGQAAPK